MSKNITVIGGGSWGTAQANVLAENGHCIKLYLRDKDLIHKINTEHINDKYFPNIKLDKNITAVNDLTYAVVDAEIIVMAIPTQSTRSVMENIKASINDNQLFISTAKGIEKGSFLRNSEIINLYGGKKVVVLSGPTHAEEIINNIPSAIVAASPDKNLAETVQDLFMTSNLRVYTNPDIVGVELAGAVKNVIAVASGITDGLGLGDNTKAALMTRGLMEMSKLGIQQGGRPLTFAGLAGMGDLVVTCTSMHSRNRRFGIKIGEGLNLNEAAKEVKQVVEGAKTTAAIKNWLKLNENNNLEMPITEQIYEVLYNDKPALEAVEKLMLRGPKHEMEEVVTNPLWDISTLNYFKED